MKTRLGILLTTLTSVLAVLLAAAPAAPAAPDPDRAGDGCRRTLAAYPVLERGDRGRAVRTLQCTLNDLDYGRDVAVDGWYGPQTRRAVRRVEDSFEGEPRHPGRISAGYWTLMFARQLSGPGLRRGDRGHDVRLLQRSLRAAGGEIVVDGRFGPQTRGVVRAYQRHLGHRPTGRVDESTAFMLAQGATF